MVCAIANIRSCVHAPAFTPLRSPAKRGKPRHGFKIAEILIVAYIQAARVAHRLEVPRGVPSNTQRVVDEMTALLARDDFAMQGRQVPAPRDLGEKFPHARRVLRAGREIMSLVRIVL